MTKRRNNKFNKKNRLFTSGGTELSQKYSLASIDEGGELGGFKHSNTILGILGVGSLIYYIYYKQNIYT